MSYKNLKNKFFLFTFLVFAFTLKSTNGAFEEENEKSSSTFEVASYFNEATNIVLFLLAFVFVASLIGFLISGIRYLIAGGDQENLDQASKIWQSSLMGLFISLVGYVIIKIFQFLT
jgi:ABC-type Fe3+ transport system permease subunit